jgi:hypothetical protein
MGKLLGVMAMIVTIMAGLGIGWRRILTIGITRKTR